MRNIIQDFKFIAGKRLKLDIPGSFFAILTGTDDVTVTLLKNNSPISHFDGVKSGLTVEAKDFQNNETSFDSFVVISTTTQTLKLAIGIDKFTYAKSSGITETTGGSNNTASPPIVSILNTSLAKKSYIARDSNGVAVNGSVNSIYNPIGSGVVGILLRAESTNNAVGAAQGIKIVAGNVGAISGSAQIINLSSDNTNINKCEIYYADVFVGFLMRLGSQSTPKYLTSVQPYVIADFETDGLLIQEGYSVIFTSNGTGVTDEAFFRWDER